MVWREFKNLAVASNHQIGVLANPKVPVKEEPPWELDYLAGYSLATVKEEDVEPQMNSGETTPQSQDSPDTSRENSLEPIEELSFKCQHCSKGFSRKCNLLRHERFHSEERPFPCKDCGKTFKLKHHLNEHQLIHDNGNRFECDICSKTFPQNYIQTHKRLHTDKRPYKCDLCEKSYKIKRDLTRHKKIHQEKSLPCPKCFYKFRMQHQLRRHVEKCPIIEGQQLFKCNHGQCSRVFQNQRSLNNHLLLLNHTE